MPVNPFPPYRGTGDRTVLRFDSREHEDRRARRGRFPPYRPGVYITQSLQQFSIRSAGLALDAGCGGTASFSIACAERAFQNVAAIDINERRLRHAGAVTRDLDRGAIRLCTASVGSMPFQNKTFDFAACSGVVHQTPDHGTTARIVPGKWVSFHHAGLEPRARRHCRSWW